MPVSCVYMDENKKRGLGKRVRAIFKFQIRKDHKPDEDLVCRPCPVCGKHTFSDVFEKCPVCGWENDYVQESNPDWHNCANEMSLNDARKAYAEGKTIC